MFRYMKSSTLFIWIIIVVIILLQYDYVLGREREVEKDQRDREHQDDQGDQDRDQEHREHQDDRDQEHHQEEHHEEEHKQIECGNDYLSNTIGLSITNNQIYQIIFENQIIHTIIYPYRDRRIIEIRKIINDDNEEQINYKMNLINGKDYKLEQLIPFPEIYKQILQSFFDLKQQQQKMSSIIMLDDGGGGGGHGGHHGDNNNDHQQIRFFSYVTTLKIEHFIIDYNPKNSLQQIDISEMKFSNRTEMVAASNGNHFRLVTFVINDDSIRIGKFLESKQVIYRLYIDHMNEKQFISMSERMENIEPELDRKYRKNIQKYFGQYKFEYGFIETFLCKEENIEPYEEEILFIFSNQNKKILTLNIGNIFTGQSYIPYSIYNYIDFFHCESLSDDQGNQQGNQDNNQEDNNQEGDRIKKRCYQKKSTTNNNNNDKENNFKIYIIIISVAIIIMIIFPLIAIISMICYSKGRCQCCLCHRLFNRMHVKQMMMQLEKQQQRKQENSNNLISRTIESTLLTTTTVPSIQSTIKTKFFRK